MILYEQGFVAPKSAFKLPIFLGKLGLQEIIVPYYPSGYTLLPESNIKTRQNNQIIQQGKTAIIVDAATMEMKSLFGSIYSVVSAQADQRSWLLLPNNIAFV